MKWIKKGLVIKPTGELDWMITHAGIPFAKRIEEDIYRIYFSGRDKLNRAQIGYIEVNINEPRRILYITEKPVLGLGDLGCFDDSGVMTSWIVDKEGIEYLFYTGWNQGITVPYYFYVGLAISKDGGKTFERISKAPILERNSYDPYLTASPCVLIEDDVWRMWYVTSIKRERKNDKIIPYYHIKYAESNDGISWERRGIVCIDFKSEEEYAIARPCVIKEDDIYKMWYSYSSGSYRIGYAESNDGIHWERKDEDVGIDVSESGWDSDMMAYPFVFEHKGKKYMLYNGNSFGKDGFGYAILEENE